MEKSITARFQKDDRPFTFLEAVGSMLNCSEYLMGEGFKYTDWHIDTGEKYYISGLVQFKDGVEINYDNFKNSADKYNVIKKIYNSKGSFFKKDYVNYITHRIIRTTLRNKNYIAWLTIAELSLPVIGYFFKPKNFEFRYSLDFNKDIITDSDVVQFFTYQYKLDLAAKYPRREWEDRSRKTSVKPATKPKKPKAFPDPWAVNIDNIETLRDENSRLQTLLGETL